MMRNAGHGNRLARGLTAVGQGDVQQLSRAPRVVKKQLVEIPHPVEEQQIGVLRLETEILLHHRRMGGVGLRHGGSG